MLSERGLRWGGGRSASGESASADAASGIAWDGAEKTMKREFVRSVGIRNRYSIWREPAGRGGKAPAFGSLPAWGWPGAGLALQDLGPGLQKEATSHSIKSNHRKVSNAQHRSGTSLRHIAPGVATTAPPRPPHPAEARSNRYLIRLRLVRNPSILFLHSFFTLIHHNQGSWCKRKEVWKCVCRQRAKILSERRR